MGALMVVLELRSKNLAPNVVQNLGSFSVTMCVMAGLFFFSQRRWEKSYSEHVGRGSGRI